MEYGKDIINKLEKSLSEELAKSIDAQIIKDLFNKPLQRKSSINKIFSS